MTRPISVGLSGVGSRSRPARSAAVLMAAKEARSGNVSSFDTVEELMVDLNAED
jgi:hypothetical protein